MQPEWWLDIKTKPIFEIKGQDQDSYDNGFQTFMGWMWMIQIITLLGSIQPDEIGAHNIPCYQCYDPNMCPSPGPKEGSDSIRTFCSALSKYESMMHVQKITLNWRSWQRNTFVLNFFKDYHEFETELHLNLICLPNVRSAWCFAYATNSRSRTQWTVRLTFLALDGTTPISLTVWPVEHQGSTTYS